IASVMMPTPQLPPGLNAFMTLTASPDLMIGYLDRAYIESTWLPSLAARYFPSSGADPYRLAVIDPRKAGTPVMTDNWPTGTPIDPAHADANEPIFQLRPDVTAGFLQRSFISLSPTMTVRGGGASGSAPRQATGGDLGRGAVGTVARTAESSTFQIA